MKKALITLPLIAVLSACGTIKTSAPITPEATYSPKPEETVIELSQKSAKTDGFFKIRSCEYDFDADGVQDTLTLYSNAQADGDGKIMWDDFHQWLLEAELASGGFYNLFDSSVSTGQLYFEVAEIYNEEVAPVVTTFLTTGSSLDIEQFVYEAGVFKKSVIYSTEEASTSGINRVYSSVPHYK